MVSYHKHWCSQIQCSALSRFIAFLLSSIQATFLQWPRELSPRELPAQGCRKWQLRKWGPEWWIAGNRSSQCVSVLPINSLHCAEQGHTWARVSPTCPRRDYKPTALLSEGFFQGALKFRNLDLLLYIVQCKAELVSFGADYGKVEEK